MHIESIKKRAQGLYGQLEYLKTMHGRRCHAFDGDPMRIRNQFLADVAKILSSKAIRRLQHKTQVVTAMPNPYIRNRATHVQEVVAISLIISEMLGLNTDLTAAIAWAHDIGHVPFGHQGEAWMAKAMGRPEFCHEVMGPIVLQFVERDDGMALNLTFETLDGGMRHSGDRTSPTMTPEAWVVRYADKIAYLFADINDVVKRLKYPMPPELIALVNEFGPDQRTRGNTALCALVIESVECGHVSFEHSKAAQKFSKIRKMMYEIYVAVTEQNPERWMGPTLEALTRLKVGDPFLLLALMTDVDVIRLAAQPMLNITHFADTAIGELIAEPPDGGPSIIQKIGMRNLCDPGLNW